MITKYGARAILRRASGDRDCTACEVQASPVPRPGNLRNSPERVFLVVAEGLDPAPDTEQDYLVWLPGTPDEEKLRLISPVGKLAPGGVVVYYELSARR